VNSDVVVGLRRMEHVRAAHAYSALNGRDGGECGEVRRSHWPERLVREGLVLRSKKYNTFLTCTKTYLGNLTFEQPP
jgi:hypothetical protein